jgi:hypothetical protein
MARSTSNFQDKIIKYRALCQESKITRKINKIQGIIITY